MVSSNERCIPCEDGRALLVMALVIRITWALIARKFWGYHDDGAYDDGIYLDMARGFLSGGHVLATHPPGYPIFLAPFLAIPGSFGVSMARWTQILISALTPVLVYRLALQLRATRQAALISGLFIVFNPMLIYFSARIMSESLFVAIIVLFFLSWTCAWQTGSWRYAALSGAIAGAASEIRGVILPFGLILALTALWQRREQKKWLQLVAACGLFWALIITPWTLRNWTVYHRFVPVSIQGGWNFYEGLTIDPDEIRYKRAQAMGEEARQNKLNDAFSADAYFGAKAKAWLSKHPVEFLKICVIKAMRFWRIAPEPPHSLVVRISAGLYALILFSMTILGFKFAMKSPSFWFLIAWVLFLNILHAVFSSNLRYRLPIEPILAIIAGFAVNWQQLKRTDNNSTRT